MNLELEVNKNKCYPAAMRHMNAIYRKPTLPVDCDCDSGLESIDRLFLLSISASLCGKELDASIFSPEQDVVHQSTSYDFLIG